MALELIEYLIITIVGACFNGFVIALSEWLIKNRVTKKLNEIEEIIKRKPNAPTS